MVNVAPQVETDPVSGSGDVADHAMVWLHPTDLTRSLIVGTSKDTTQGGMHVFDLEGTEVDFLQVGACNNLDIRYGFPLGSNTIDLIGTSNRTLNRVQFFTIDPDTGELTVLGTHTVDTNDIYGFCLAHDEDTDKWYSIATFLDGTVEQYELDGSTGSIVATKKRTISVGSQTEGAVADDDLGFLYLAEEDVGVWRYGLDPSSGSTRTAVDNVSGHLTADVEGMALYRESDNANGYLIVSSQGDSTFQVYERDDQTWVGEIAVVAGNGIDAVSDTDGISVTNRNLGAPFASGAFVVHDGAGSDPTNYKLVSWADIATALSLRTPDTTFDPRGGVGPTDITWGEWSNPVQTADPGGVVWGEYSEEVIATQVVGSQVEPEPDPPVITSDQVDDAWSGDFSRAPGFWIRPTQSCHWWNAAAQRWDGLIPDDSGSDHHIVTGINGAQDWEIEVEGRASVRCDTWWDESSATLYVAAQHSSDSTLYRITYNSGNDTYTLAATTSIPSAFQIGAEPDSGELRPLVIHRSPNGNLWLAQNNENELWVSRSTDNGATWATPVDLKSVNGDRGSVGFGDGPGGLVVLFAAENSGGDYYAFSIAQDAGAITAGNWTNESGSLPALTGGVGSDDHICVRSHDGVVYAVCKTENPGSGDDFHVLFVRDTNGDWSKITILEGPDAGNRPSRPSIAIDAEWNRLFYFTAYIADNVVDYRAAYLDSLEDLATESFVEVMEGNYVWFTGGITPKLPVNHESGLLIMGNDQGNTGGTPFADIWWGHLTISEAPEESPGESPGESPAEEPEVEAALASYVNRAIEGVLATERVVLAAQAQVAHRAAASSLLVEPSHAAAQALSRHSAFASVGQVEPRVEAALASSVHRAQSGLSILEPAVVAALAQTSHVAQQGSALVEPSVAAAAATQIARAVESVLQSELLVVADSAIQVSSAIGSLVRPELAVSSALASVVDRALSSVFAVEPVATSGLATSVHVAAMSQILQEPVVQAAVASVVHEAIASLIAVEPSAQAAVATVIHRAIAGATDTAIRASLARTVHRAFESLVGPEPVVTAEAAITVHRAVAGASGPLLVVETDLARTTHGAFASVGQVEPAVIAELAVTVATAVQSLLVSEPVVMADVAQQVSRAVEGQAGAEVVVQASLARVMHRAIESLLQETQPYTLFMFQDVGLKDMTHDVRTKDMDHDARTWVSSGDSTVEGEPWPSQ